MKIFKLPGFIKYILQNNIVKCSCLLLIATIVSITCYSQKKYNVIFINVDDMSIAFDTYGNSFAPAPNINRLAQHGVMFRNVYCQYSLCSPSRTSTFSGTRVQTTQIVDNTDSIRKTLGQNFRFLPEYFHDYGYRTECYGKFMCAHDDEVSWDYYINETPDGGFTDGNDEEQSFTNGPLGGATGRQEPIWFIDTIHKNINSTDDGKETNQFITALKNPKSQPYFYNLGLQTHNFFTPLLQYWNKTGDASVSELLPVDSAFIYTNVYGNGSANIPLSDCPKNDTVDIPHIALKQPYNYTPDAIQRLRHAYYAEMIQADVNIGKVLDQIDSLDLWKNSVIVFWSDHGLSMGEHDGMYLKIDMFEECLRIPVIICAPGIEPGVCNRLVESVDLFQTLTELCGLPPHGNQEGTSFVPLLEKPDLPWKKAIFSNLQRNVNYDTLLATAVRTENWHYNNWQDQGEELYDIINDSQEITNLAQNPAYIDTLNKMRTLMNSGWRAAAPPVYNSSRFYRDADGDGYGSNTDSAYLYFSKDGYVKISGDCDDNNSFVNPAMPETICNNMDDNCNKIIDEGKPLASIAASGEPDICGATPLTFTANGNDSCIYQWLNNNTPIAGALKKTITVNETGHYTVIVEWPNGCADTSDEILAYKSCEPQSIIPLYPNPSNGKIIINYLNTLDEVVKINIYNNLGALVYSESDYSKTGINVYTIDLSTRLRPGIYYLRIKDDIKVKFEIVN